RERDAVLGAVQGPADAALPRGDRYPRLGRDRLERRPEAEAERREQEVLGAPPAVLPPELRRRAAWDRRPRPRGHERDFRALPLDLDVIAMRQRFHGFTSPGRGARSEPARLARPMNLRCKGSAETKARNLACGGPATPQRSRVAPSRPQPLRSHEVRS